MKLLLALLVTMHLSIANVAVAADEVSVAQKVEKTKTTEKKVKKKHKKYAGTKIPDKVPKK
jgi:hypothetical protein